MSEREPIIDTELRERVRHILTGHICGQLSAPCGPLSDCSCRDAADDVMRLVEREPAAAVRSGPPEIVRNQCEAECEAVMSNAEHRKKIAHMECHKSEISFQDGRWHAAYDILEAIRATTPADQELQTT